MLFLFVRFHFAQKQKTSSVNLRFFIKGPGGVLLSHGKVPHYHRRYNISLLSSVWYQVELLHYGRQDYSVMICLALFFFFLCFDFICLRFLSIYYKLNLFDFLLFVFVMLCYFLFCFTSLVALFRFTSRQNTWGCIVKPLGQLVSVSSMAHTTYTSDLSTS